MAQKVLITAAASGIGLEIARAFAEAGSTVFITDIHRQTIDAATIEVPGLLATLCNNGKRSDIERMVPEIRKRKLRDRKSEIRKLRDMIGHDGHDTYSQQF
jgi:short-subunit dehydrogenase involved in D-alanine esterification of teichoic acids